MGKFIIHKTATGFRFLLKAGNGQVLAASEVYRSRRACQQGMDSVRKNTAAPVEDQTRQGAEPLPCPKFELYRDKTGSFRFRLRARNGEIIAASDGYTARAGCLKAIESFRKNAPGAAITEE